MSLQIHESPFHFINDEYDGAEHVQDYKPGGYHPVHLGDTFPTHDSPRYRILYKLGHGVYSTVWLARDLVVNRYVALKIVVGSNVIPGSIFQPRQHGRIFLVISETSNHIIQLRDSFQIHGPNGTHQVLVMDVLHSSASHFGQERSICYQLLLGLSYLQQVHCDLHVDSIGFRIPDIDQFTEDQLLQWMGHPKLSPVVPRDPSVQSDSLPKYLVSYDSIGTYDLEQFTGSHVQLFAQIIGFCHAFRMPDCGPLPETPFFVRAPELTFYELSNGQVEKEWGLPSDVWSMAWMIFELRFGFVMGRWTHCEGCVARMMESKGAYIFATMRRIGPLPERWKPYWDSKPFEDPNGNLTIDPDAQWPKYLEGREKDPDALTLVDLVRSMLRWEPADRPAVVNLLTHPWFMM